MPKQLTRLKLSICIPAYNRPVWIRRALLSLLDTAPEIQNQVEVIISDDSTIPNTQTSVNELLTTWKGAWTYQANSPSLGMAANWNCCIHMASGEYVLILHDDDYLQPKAINRIVTTLCDHAEASALLFGVNVVDPNGKVIKRQASQFTQFLTQEEALQLVLTNSSFIRFPGMVFRKTIFKEVGYFDETIGGIADIHLWVRICQEYGLLYVSDLIANYTVHSNALTMNMFTLDTLRKIDKIFYNVEIERRLPIKTIQTCKTNYFYQFILAGTVRYMKERNFKDAKKTFKLLDKVDIKHELAFMKWKVLKKIFQTSLSLS